MAESLPRAEREDTPSLFRKVSAGEPAAKERLYEVMHGHLRAIATALLSREGRASVRPTLLVDEAFLKALGDSTTFTTRERFLAASANAMRRLLVDHARLRLRAKRNSGRRPVELKGDETGTATDCQLTLDIHDALTRLSNVGGRAARAAQIVELRFFAGLDVAEAATMVGVSERTAALDWDFARAFLRRALGAS